METTFTILSWTPFTVEYRRNERIKIVKYDVALTKREIQSEAEYIIFDN